MLSIQELRLKCLEFVIKNNRSASPIYQMIEAQMLFQWITTGNLPVKTSNDAMLSAEILLNKAIDILIEERKNGNQSTDSGNANPDDLNVPKSFVSRFLSKLGRK